MTVAELIKKLQELDPRVPIHFSDGEVGAVEITLVSQDTKYTPCMKPECVRARRFSIYNQKSCGHSEIEIVWSVMG